MNPLGLLTLALGVVIIIVGVKGSQHALVSALTGKNKTDTSSSSSSSSQPTSNITSPNTTLV